MKKKVAVLGATGSIGKSAVDILCQGNFDPVHAALHWPEIIPSPLEPLDFEGLSLSFEKPDTDRFPMLSLAYEACKKGVLFPAVYNAANEIAVEAFLKKGLPFLEIPRIVEYVLNSSVWQENKNTDPAVPCLAEILETDRKARDRAMEYIKEHIR